MKVASFLLLVLAAIVIATCSCGKIPYDIVVNEPIKPKADVLKGHDKVLVRASDKYQAGLLRELFRGKNYRPTWYAPVEAPILWLDTLRGGLEIVEEGGGGQSRSMDLKDKQGHYFKLRSISKNPTANAPKAVMTLGLGQLIADVTSAGHPYGAMPAAVLSEAAGIAHTHPSLYYLPRQPALDTFNERFGNRLFLLEYDPQGKQGDWVLGEQKVIDMPKWEDVKENLIESRHHHIRQEILLKARLLDLIIGDWDRHPGNWGWAAYQQGGETYYKPIAIDRDMAFFKLEGFLPWLITQSFIQPRYKPYRKKIKYLPRMLDNSKEIHAVGLNLMTAEDFQRAAHELQQVLTDDIIDEALHTWPDTIYQLNAGEVGEKIRAIRDDLPKYAAKFYRLIAEKVEVAGTDEPDLFLITPLANGDIRIELTAGGQGMAGQPFYERTFHPHETKEIALLGMGGDDEFRLLGTPGRKMKINIVGGYGHDAFVQPEGDGKPYPCIALYDKDAMQIPSGHVVLVPHKGDYYWLREDD